MHHLLEQINRLVDKHYLHNRPCILQEMKKDFYTLKKMNVFAKLQLIKKHEKKQTKKKCFWVTFVLGI